MAGPDYQAGRLAIIVTADESAWDDTSNTVLTTVISPAVTQGLVVSTPLNHYSLSGFLSDVAHGPRLNDAATAPDFAGAFGLTVG
jgi:acid phosphatase